MSDEAPELRSHRSIGQTSLFKKYFYGLVFGLTFGILCYSIHKESYKDDRLNVFKSYGIVASNKLSNYIPGAVEDREYYRYSLSHYFVRQIPYCLCHIFFCVLFSLLFPAKHYRLLRLLSSVIVLIWFAGARFAVVILSQSLLFFFTSILVCGHRSILWLIAIVALWFTEKLFTDLYLARIFFGPGSNIHYQLLCTAYAFGLVRAISMGITLCSEFQVSMPFDWRTKLHTFFDVLDYAFYPYPLLTGPIIIYPDWVVHHGDQKSTVQTEWPVGAHRYVGRLRQLTWSHLLRRALRFALWMALRYIFFTLFHPFAILSSYSNFALDAPWHVKNNILGGYVLWGVITLVSVGFYFDHLFLYSQSALLSDLELFLVPYAQSPVLNLRSPAKLKVNEDKPVKCEWSCEANNNSLNVTSSYRCLVPAPPSCVMHLSLGSELWRMFDRGVYNFGMCHVFRPIRRMLNFETQSLLSTFLQTALPYLMPFVFTLMFHHPSLANVIWISFNITIMMGETLSGKMAAILHSKQLLSAGSILRIGAVMSAFRSAACLISFTFFIFGYELGVLFMQHVFTNYGTFVFLALLIVRYHFSVSVRSAISYQGLPSGFKDS